jgi:putative lipoprotein
MLVRLIVVAMIVVGCQTTQETVTAAQAQAPVPSLVGTSWTATDIDGRGVLDRARSTVTLEASQRLSGNTACNRYFGTYELGEGTLRLKPAGSTRMACEPPVMEQETRFLAALEAVTAFRREGTDLLLLDASGRVRVRLTPAGPDRPTGQAPTGQAPVAPPLLRAHVFDCADGPSIVALSQPEGAGRGETIDLVLPDGRRRLPRVPTASGERYAERGVSFWSKGRKRPSSSTAERTPARRTGAARSPRMRAFVASSCARWARSPAGLSSSSAIAWRSCEAWRASGRRHLVRHPRPAWRPARPSTSRSPRRIASPCGFVRPGASIP